MSKETQAWVQLAGRILLGMLFLISGTRKALAFGGSVAYMTKFGVPMAEPLLVITLILEIGGGAMILLGWKARYAALALALFVLIVSPIFHGYWTYEPAQLGNQLNHFYKNMSIVGGLLFLFAFGAGAYSLDGRAASPAAA